MAFAITRDATIHRDHDGHTRHVSHPDRPFDTGLAGLQSDAEPQRLAESYLREIRAQLQLPAEAMEDFARPVEWLVPGRGAESCRFLRAKRVADMVVLSYAQTLYDVPVWLGGITVRLREAPLAAIAAQNEWHYGLEVRPPANAAFLPERLTAYTLEELFPPGALPGLPTINKARLWIFRYDPARRARSEDEGPAGGDAALTIPLKPVAAGVRSLGHHVVTEVLFSLPLEGRSVNWRGFVEVETGSILYLRPLIAHCASGLVYQSDPVSMSGRVVPRPWPLDDLNALRSKVELLLDDPPPSGEMALQGPWVRVFNMHGPGPDSPTQRHPFEFHYEANQPEFAAVNAYYHCDRVFRLFEQWGLEPKKYFDGTRFPVSVDPEYRGRGNACTIGNLDGNGIEGFGFGRAATPASLGAAVDVRVILHEFGHGILLDHVHELTLGFSHSVGDSLAAILEDPDSRAPDRFATFPFDRHSRRHDRSIADGWAWGGSRDSMLYAEYDCEQILSTTLFRVYRACGGDDGDRAMRIHASHYVVQLILKAVGFLTPLSNPTEPEVFAQLLMDADAMTESFQGCRGHVAHKVIRWSFELQGLYRRGEHDGSKEARGRPPDVDVYLDQGRGRDAEYEYQPGEYLPYLSSPDSSEDVWNRRVADSAAEHEPPVGGVPSYLYVRVRNRGTTPACGVTVRTYQCGSADGRRWPVGWYAAAAPAALSEVLAPGAAAICGPIAWTPASSGVRVLASVSAEGDASNAERRHAAPDVPLALLVSTDNNIAVRDMSS